MVSTALYPLVGSQYDDTNVGWLIDEWTKNLNMVEKVFILVCPCLFTSVFWGPSTVSDTCNVSNQICGKNRWVPMILRIIIKPTETPYLPRSIESNHEMEAWVSDYWYIWQNLSSCHHVHTYYLITCRHSTTSDILLNGLSMDSKSPNKFLWHIICKSQFLDHFCNDKVKGNFRITTLFPWK